MVLWPEFMSGSKIRNALNECHEPPIGSTKHIVNILRYAGVKPTFSPSGTVKRMPYSMGVRWLAFQDSKPVHHHLSRCGDASTDESQPLTSTVLNVNKRIWNSLSALASTVVSSNQSTTSTSGAHTTESYRNTRTTEQVPLVGSSESNAGVDSTSTSTSPGYVTIVDLSILSEQYEEWKTLEAATSTVSLSSNPVSVDSNAQVGPAGDQMTGKNSNGVLSGTAYVNVHDHCDSGSVVAHFMAHRWASVALLRFSPSGSLLFTACTRGHTFNLFRISSHPYDQRQTAMHHLYILERGTIPCEILDATFSQDSRWIAVSSNHGTTHVFPITPYGGPVTVRTHTRPYVVNRTSRYHRSSGLDEHHLTRPQRERSATEPTGPTASSGTGSCSSSFGEHTRGSLRAPPGGNTCRGAPMAGLSPQCPHLGVTSPNLMTGSGGSGSGDSTVASTTTSTITRSDHTNIVNMPAEGACACPLNALHNTTNSRLPPYPEPCLIRPEARLRPHNPTNATGGAAAAAFGAAGDALEAVATGSCSSSSTTSSSTTAALPSRYLTGSGGGGGGGSYSMASHSHPGPCVHYPAPPPPQQNPSNMEYQRSRHGHPRYQPLPTVDPYVMDPFAGPPCGPCIAARFAPPVCFLLNRPRQATAHLDQSRDPYSNKARAVDGLFILTPDLHLVEYELLVGSAENVSYGRKLYQEGSIRLECAPVGEWNLRTDAVCLPPFSKQHPFVAAARMLQEGVASFSKDPSTLGTALIDPTGDNEASRTTGKSDKESACAAPEGWSGEDAASYWYSQVEITTHLGPLRRVWMGPQFNFYANSKSPEPIDSVVSLSPSLGMEEEPGPKITSIKMLQTVELSKLLPSCHESSSMTAHYSMHSMQQQQHGVQWNLDGDSVEFACGTEASTIASLSPHRPLHSKPLTPRLAANRLMEGGGGPGGMRWRNRSGDLTRPISIAGSMPGGPGSDAAIVIEGGSYQGSSLGGSLSSLVSRGGDDVANCIAEAMQDEDTFWSNERTTSELGSCTTPLGSTGPGSSVLQFSVRSPSTITAVPSTGSRVSVTIQSALSEADFPSQEDSASPQVAIVLPDSPHSPPDTPAPILSIVPDETVKQIPDDVPFTEPDQPATSYLPASTKKSKRAKKGRSKKSKATTSSTGELTSIGNEQQSGDDWKESTKMSLTSPSASGLESLSSSPAVGEGFQFSRGSVGLDRSKRRDQRHQWGDDESTGSTDRSPEVPRKHPHHRNKSPAHDAHTIDGDSTFIRSRQDSDVSDVDSAGSPK